IKSRFSFSEKRKKAEDKYEVSYIEESGVNKISLKEYKNRKKKKLVSVHHFTMESHPELNNQFYVNPALAFAYKFDITQVKTEELVAEAYLTDQQSHTKEQIWKMIDIARLAFQINVPAEYRAHASKCNFSRKECENAGDKDPRSGFGAGVTELGQKDANVV